MLIALNALRRRHRHRSTAVLLALALSCLLIAAHSALAERHMGDEIACLAVAETAAPVVAVAIAAVAAATTVLPRATWRRLDMAPGVWFARCTPGPRSRAGPAFLQVFRQ
jgi:hypothetical protein